METQPPQGISLKQVFDIALRRKALLATCILLAITVGLSRYITQPKTYQGIALLSYQQQSINPTQMSPDEEAKIKDIVSTLSEIVTSRTSLEKIIENENLYTKLREQLPMDDVIEVMRKSINITPSRKGDTFIVSYDSKNPNIVAKVTNTIASGFIEENMKYREEKAAETSTYTQDELEMAKVILDKKEAIMRDYKLKHYNEMPEQRIVNMTRLTSLQTEYQSKQESIQELERTRVLIRDQIEVRKQMLSSLSPDPATSASQIQSRQVESDPMKLKRFKKILLTLEQKYTDKHPKIKSLKKKIQHLQESVANSSGETATDSAQGMSSANFDNTLFELQTELKGIGLSINKINTEKKETLAKIKQYEKSIAAAPIREAEWSALTREYGELKRHYDHLVSQNLQAGSALNLERKQKGSQFKIVDPARTPQKPIKPDFIKIMKIVLLGGTIAAICIAGALETFSTTYKDPAKLAQNFGLEVICSIPHINLKKERFLNRLKTTLGTLFFISWAGAIAIAIIFLKINGKLIF